MKTRILGLTIFFVVILFSIESVEACSCMGVEKPSEEFRKTPVVFVGTVKSVNSADSRKFGDESNLRDLQTIFTVDEAFKGVKTNEIDIYTSSQRTGCGFEFEKGKQYLVYAYGGDEKRKYHSTSFCTRTRLAEGEDDEIEILRSLSKGKFEPRIYGKLEEITRGIFLLDDKDDVPMSGIKITAQSSNGIYKSITDKEGEFRFVNVKPGNYKLNVELPTTHKIGDDSWGFIEKQKVNLDYIVTDRDCPDFITIKTRINGRIKGKILDFQGNSVGKGVRVTLVTKDTVNNADNQIQYIGTDTDKKGFYEFDGIPQGEYYLGINLDLRQPYKDNPYPKTFYPNGSESKNAALIKLGYGQKLDGFDINLPASLKSVIVKGKVTKSNGTPAVGVTVYVTNQARHNFEDFTWLKTDQNGEFSANCLEGLTYRFTAYEKDSKGDDKESSEKIETVKSSMKLLEFVIQ